MAAKKRMKKENTKFIIDCKTEEKASELLYKFMTSLGLTQPECNYSKKNNICTLSEEEVSSMTKEQFLKKISGNGLVACVASTDKEDERRVTLAFMEKINTIMVNFPYAYNGMTPEEERLLWTLNCMTAKA